MQKNPIEAQLEVGRTFVGFARAHPAFMRFWFASASSSLGFQMLSVAVGWQIYSITGRALDLGLVGLVQFIPSLLLALPAGEIADRYDRSRIVRYGQWIAGLTITVLAALTFFAEIRSLAILALVSAIGIAKAFESPSLHSMLPSLVPRQSLPRALAVNAAAEQAAMIAGPALGGLLYMVNPGAVYVIAALLHLAAALMLKRLRYEERPSRRASTTWSTVFAGVRFIRGHRDVLGVISLDLFAILLGGATALLPIFARDILHTGPWGLGLLRSAPALGAVLMSFWLAHYRIKRHAGLVMFGAVAGYGVATLIFAISAVFWLSCAALIMLGACDMISMVIRGALVQLDTPDEMRGRVNAVNSIFIGTSWQLGEFESGVVAAWLGAVPAVVIGGAGTLLVVALWLLLFPTLRRRQELSDC